MGALRTSAAFVSSSERTTRQAVLPRSRSRDSRPISSPRRRARPRRLERYPPEPSPLTAQLGCMRSDGHQRFVCHSVLRNQGCRRRASGANGSGGVRFKSPTAASEATLRGKERTGNTKVRRLWIRGGSLARRRRNSAPFRGRGRPRRFQSHRCRQESRHSAGGPGVELTKPERPARRAAQPQPGELDHGEKIGGELVIAVEPLAEAGLPAPVALGRDVRGGTPAPESVHACGRHRRALSASTMVRGPRWSSSVSLEIRARRYESHQLQTPLFAVHPINWACP